MNSALWAAKTGLDAEESQMAVVANNLANVNTTGYKETRGVFQDLYYQNVHQVGGSTTQDTLAPTGMNLGTGVQMVSTEKLYTQGSVNQTGNSLDLAINGRGFFQVLMPDGTMAYTRDGSFQTNATGQVVTASGYVLQPAITIPSGAQSITIGTDGTVSVLLAGQTAPSTVGTLQQGATESSNVDVVSEMVNMIETQRAYEMDSKAIQTTDQMLQNLSTSL